MPRHTLYLFTLLVAAAAALPGPGRAAAIQTGPVSATLSFGLAWNPTSNGLAFDSSLGTLDGVTLSFTGTTSISVAGTIEGDAPYPSSLYGYVHVFYSGASGQPYTLIGPIPMPLVVSDTQYATSSGSTASPFTLAVPGADYGTGVLETDFSFGGAPFSDLAPTNNAGLVGTVSALLEYTPTVSSPGDGGPIGIPEPAGLALLASSLTVLLAVRLRASFLALARRCHGTGRRWGAGKPVGGWLLPGRGPG